MINGDDKNNNDNDDDKNNNDNDDDKNNENSIYFPDK